MCSFPFIFKQIYHIFKCHLRNVFKLHLETQSFWICVRNLYPWNLLKKKRLRLRNVSKPTYPSYQHLYCRHSNFRTSLRCGKCATDQWVYSTVLYLRLYWWYLKWSALKAVNPEEGLQSKHRLWYHYYHSLSIFYTLVHLQQSTNDYRATTMQDTYKAKLFCKGEGVFNGGKSTWYSCIYHQWW